MFELACWVSSLLAGGCCQRGWRGAVWALLQVAGPEAALCGLHRHLFCAQNLLQSSLWCEETLRLRNRFGPTHYLAG